MGMWRSDREKLPGEEAEWATLYKALAASAGVAAAAAAAEFVLTGGGNAIDYIDY